MSVTSQIREHIIVAIVRLDSYEYAIEVAQALLDGGIRVLEFTLTGTGAITAIGAVRQHFGEQLCVGVGSVLHAEQAVSAIEGGAQFAVTPAVRPAAIAACVNRDVPILCGGWTPTELLAAHEAGAAMVKLFPARMGGPEYLRDILAPLPFLPVMPTGGVSAGNARAFLDAGAVALGMGGKLVDGSAVARGDFAALTATAHACRSAIGLEPET